jgi:threonine/homoserine/homoserine lactone efflux protein
MPSPSTLAVFSVAALALLLVPGPAVLYIVTRSLSQGRTAGVASALGVAGGNMVHVVAAALGLSALLAASATAFTAVKLVGAAYLVVLGVRKLARPRRAFDDAAAAPATLRRIFAHGVVVNIFNPKVALFFLAFLPQFIEPARGAVSLQVLVLGLVFVAIGVCSDSTYALVSGTLARRLRRRVAVTDRAAGVVYIGLGVSAALAGPPRVTAAR